MMQLFLAPVIKDRNKASLHAQSMMLCGLYSVEYNLTVAKSNTNFASKSKIVSHFEKPCLRIVCKHFMPGWGG